MFAAVLVNLFRDLTVKKIHMVQFFTGQAVEGIGKLRVILFVLQCALGIVPCVFYLVLDHCRELLDNFHAAAPPVTGGNTPAEYV